MKRGSISPVRSIILSAFGAFMLSSHAFAASNAWLAGPSLTAVSEKVPLKGGGFTADQAVKVHIRDGAGAETIVEMHTSSSGALTIEVTPVTSGMHSVTVRDASGSELAKANFMSHN